MSSDQYDELTVSSAKEMRVVWQGKNFSTTEKVCICQGILRLWFAMTDGHQKDNDNEVLERFGRLGPGWATCNL